MPLLQAAHMHRLIGSPLRDSQRCKPLPPEPRSSGRNGCESGVGVDSASSGDVESTCKDTPPSGFCWGNQLIIDGDVVCTGNTRALGEVF